jgi:hypothetical protein
MSVEIYELQARILELEADNAVLAHERDHARTEQAAHADRAQVVVGMSETRALNAEATARELAAQLLAADARAGEAEAAVVQLRTERDEARESAFREGVEATRLAVLEHVRGASPMLDFLVKTIGDAIDREVPTTSKPDERELFSSRDTVIDGRVTAWRAIWDKLVDIGLLSFIGGDGTGLGRALAFIDELARRPVEQPIDYVITETGQLARIAEPKEGADGK